MMMMMMMMVREDDDHDGDERRDLELTFFMDAYIFCCLMMKFLLESSMSAMKFDTDLKL
jgi:hypothetical protein